MDPSLQKIASHFVDFTYSATQLPVIVCDETGTIRCAVDRKRIGTVHAAARRIAAGEMDEVFVTAAAENVFKGFQAVSERATAISEQAALTVTKMTEGSTSAAQKVAHSGEIMKTVMEVAQKSRILSINGSVEASRAGERGRAFSVIAQEMIRLSEDARGAANEIHRTLTDVQQSIGTLGGAIQGAAGLMKDQCDAVDEVKHVVDALKLAVTELIQASR